MMKELEKLAVESYHRGAIDSLEVFIEAFSTVVKTIGMTHINTEQVIEMVKKEIDSYKKKLEETK